MDMHLIASKKNTSSYFKFVAAIALGAIAMNSEAYIGPGAGLSAIGTVLAFLAAVALAIVGFVWYPLKRMRRRLAGRKSQSENSAQRKAPDTPVEEESPKP